MLKSRRLSHTDPTNNVKQFIQRIIGEKSDSDNFIINFNTTLNKEVLDTFEVCKIIKTYTAGIFFK